jgi:16S rRNA (guanine527-N7)-methyltransferase
VLDVGTGAGFPGLPLAILDPDTGFTLLDSVGKKVRFLNHVVRTLGLENATPVESRVESFSPAGEFSTIVSRAFAAVPAFLEATRHLSGPGTRFLAMLARRPETLSDELPAWARIDEVARLSVPGLDAERHIVVMSAQSQ